jgi:hypothetical protein
MRESQTVVLERNVEWRGAFANEPCEVAWATEAVFFVRTLEVTGMAAGNNSARIQISPDGIHWCDEGADIQLPVEPEISYGRVSHFGGWLRLAGQLPPDAGMKVIVYLVLKE